jgi:hypothetical protein
MSGETVTVIRGPPELRIVTPKRITRADLHGVIPPIRVEGTSSAEGSLFFFDDRDEDGLPGSTELVAWFRGVPEGRGFVIEDARLTSAQISKLGDHMKWGVEVIVIGTKLKHHASYAVE